MDGGGEGHTGYGRASGAGIEAEQTIWRMGAEETPLDERWRAQVLAAVLDTGGRPRRLPASVRDAMAPLISPREAAGGA